MSINVADDGKLLLCCHAGCTTAEIVETVGLTMSDLFPNNGQRRRGASRRNIVATYPYRNEQGTLLYETVRFEPKGFAQRAPNGNGGYVWKLNGVRRVPYQLPELLAADPAESVLIVEGEKDVDRLRSLRIVATCNAGGAGKWTAKLSKHLKGRRCVLCGDNDEPGKKHVATVGASLQGVAATMQVLDLPGLPEKGDVSDWLDAGGTADELQRLIAAAPEWTPSTFADSEPIANGSPSVTINETDLGNARRFVTLHGRNVRYCHPWKKWLVWDGKRWKSDDTGDVVRMATETIVTIFGDIQAQPDSKRGDLAKHATKSLQAERIRAMLFLAQSQPGIPILPEELDRNEWLLNTTNGTIDLKTGDIRGHRLEDYITKLCPTRFDPKASRDHFDRFMQSILPSQNVVDFMQRFCGYALTGSVREQLLLILYGGGSNGKSTFVNALMETLGPDYAMKADKDLLMVKKQPGHSTERMDLAGKRFVACSETEDQHQLAESFVKDLTGGEPIRGRRMREDTWQYRPTHKIALSTNHKPAIQGTDEAIWRRIRLVPFDIIFWNPDEGETGPEDRKQDKTLPEKLAAESEGILAWAVEGCMQWQQGGLGMPDEVRAATAEYRSDEDVLGRFIAECCLVNPAVRVRLKDFRAELERWCEEADEPIPSQRRVGPQLEKRGFTRRISNGTWYVGIALKASEDAQTSQ